MKKKILSVLLCGVALMTTASSALPSQFARYDLDGDGQLTADDASVIYAYILGTADEAVTLSQVDVNGDGIANTLDVVAVYVRLQEYNEYPSAEGMYGDDTYGNNEFGVRSANERRGQWGDLWE